MQLRLIVNGRVLTALVMFAIFASATLIALGFPEKAHLMPLMVGVPGSLLALAQVFLELRKTASEAAEQEAEELEEHKAKAQEERKAEAHMFLWMFLFFVGILCFGFVYAAPILVFGFLYLGKKETLKVGLFGALGTWLVLFGFFEQMFEIPLFEGLVIEWLME